MLISTAAGSGGNKYSSYGLYQALRGDTIWFGSSIIFAAGSLWYRLLSAPQSSLVSGILGRLPQLLPPAVGIYAVLVLLTTAAALIVDIRHVRSRLKIVVPLNRDLWNSTLAGSGLSRLALRLIRIIPAESISPGDRILVDSPFEARNASHEIARLYQDWLSRGHFFPALLVLLGLGAAGLPHKYAVLALTR